MGPLHVLDDGLSNGGPRLFSERILVAKVTGADLAIVST